jgi:Protein of unknown function (DUF3300)
MAEELNTMNILLSKICVLPLLFWATLGLTQVPVDDSGSVVGEWEQAGNAEATGNEGIPLLSRQELQGLVGPVALYPDDLLAIVLPASTYPLQIVQAARFLEELKSDPGLEPDEDWDDSIIAVLNYPEVIELLNEDLDWTWQLGEAVVGQQGDVVTAIEAFRNTAYAAGNLQSDEYQDVSRDEGVIEISPVNDDIIYVPYYEPERVVVYQPRPVYHYYASPYPVYNYPYADSYTFNRGFFWGVTTAFTIGWASDRLHVYHQSYSGHPYYGRYYPTRWWYRRPSVHNYNAVYANHSNNLAARHYTTGDYWRPSRNTRLRYSDQRITRNVHYPSQSTRNRGSRERDVIHYNRDTRRNTDRTVASNNRRVVSNNTQRSAPHRERSENVRRAPTVRNDRRTTDRRTRDRHASNTQPRNESRRESRNESRNASRNESRNASRNESRNNSHKVEQRQARNREEPRRRKN